MKRLLAAALLGVTPALAQDAANGELLYVRYCIECHGFPPLRGPETAPYNPDLIRSAIESRVSRMRHLSFLTDAHLTDIATFIGRALGIVPRPAHDYSDLWWNPAEPGWGLSLVQHGEPGDQLFAVLYTYEASRRPLWLVMPGGAWLTPTVFSGDLFRTSGPAAHRPFDAARVSVSKVGSAKLTFSANDTATLSYSVEGVAVEQPIRRQPF